MARQPAGRGRVPLTHACFVTVPAVSSDGWAGRRRLRPLVLGTAALAALAAAGCGEKSEPAVHPPTTAAATTTATGQPAPAPTATKPTQTPTAPAPEDDSLGLGGRLSRAGLRAEEVRELPAPAVAGSSDRGTEAAGAGVGRACFGFDR